MKKIIIGIIVIVIVAGGYILFQNKKIKSQLLNVNQSQIIDQNATSTTKSFVDSEVSMTRVNGVWTVDSGTKYIIDPNSIKFNFIGYKPGGQHVGTFNNMKVDIALDKEGKPIGAVMSMDVTSIKTDSATLDKHLQSTDFFDSSKNPLVMVAVKSVQMTSTSTANAISDVSMAGITKTLLIPVKFVPVQNGTKFTVDTKIPLSQFDMSYGPVIDQVRVMIEGVLRKA